MYFTNLFIRSIKNADLIHSQEFDLYCRGLIYRTHLFDYINKLNGFNFSYVCVWFFLCRGLIYQTQIFSYNKTGGLDKSSPYRRDSSFLWTCALYACCAGISVFSLVFSLLEFAGFSFLTWASQIKTFLNLRISKKNQEKLNLCVVDSVIFIEEVSSDEI